MHKLLVAAAAAVGLLITSAAAARTISVATLTGDWNDNTVYTTWSAKIEFDPSLATVRPFEDGYQLYWDSSMGTPSPLLDMGVHLNKRNVPPSWAYKSPEYFAELYGGPTDFESSTFTQFSLKVSTFHYLFEIAGPDLGGQIGSGAYRDGFQGPGEPYGHFDQRPVFFGSGIPAPDDEVFLWRPIVGDYGDLLLPGTLYTGGEDTNVVRVQRVAVPEPSTWLLMMAGCATVGARFRCRRIKTMKTATHRPIRGICLMLLMTLGTLMSPLSAQASDIFFGSSDGATCLPYGCGGVTDVALYQQVYQGMDSGFFEEALFFYQYSDPVNGSYPRVHESIPVEGHFFYTDKAAGGLSLNPAENVGAPLEAFAGHRGFLYDNTRGNLLIQVEITEAFMLPSLEDADSPVMSRLVVRTGETTGSQYAGGLVTRIRVVPEPASWALMIAGFGAVGTSLRRRGRLATTQ